MKNNTRHEKNTFGVIIPTKNRLDDLMCAVNSVLSQSQLPDELIIVDQSVTNTADSAIWSLLANHRQIDYKYIFNNTLTGLTAARIVAVKASISDLLLFIDDDIILDKNFIQVVLGVFKQRPDLSGVGGVAQLPTHRKNFSQFLRGKIAPFFRIGPFYDVRIPLQYGIYPKGQVIISSKFLCGGLSALRRDLFQHVEFDGYLKGASVIEDLDFYSRANSFKFAIALQAKAVHNSLPLSKERLLRSFEMKSWGFSYVFLKNIPKTPLNYIAFFWRNIGFLLEAIFESLRYRTFNPIIGIIKGWRSPFNNPNFIKK